jgi:hypothetical protein
MRQKMRVFLVHYEKCLSLATAADRTKISPRLPYVWKNRGDRTGRWFVKALQRAEHVGVQRIRAEAVDAALIQRSESAIFNILKARDPWFMPKPKEVSHQHQHSTTTVTQNLSATSISAGHPTDDELETADRLLKKMGVPEHLLKAAPSDGDE